MKKSQLVIKGVNSEESDELNAGRLREERKQMNEQEEPAEMES